LQSKRKRDLRIGALKLENRARYAQMVVREISRGFSTACELNQEPGAIAVPALNVHWPDKPSRAAGRGRNTAGTFDSSVAAASHTEVAANLANQNTFQERSLSAGKMPGYTPQTGNFANLDIATRNEPLAGKRQGSSIARG
jgi:hypothetical protein